MAHTEHVASPLQVLVVDDDPTMRRLLTRALGRGCIVRTAATARGAIEWRGEVDLLVTDLMLPDGKGPDVALALRQRKARLPVLLITATPEELDPKDASLFVDVLEKPFRLAQLYDALAGAKAAARPRVRSAIVAADEQTASKKDGVASK